MTHLKVALVVDAAQGGFPPHPPTAQPLLVVDVPLTLLLSLFLSLSPSLSVPSPPLLPRSSSLSRYSSIKTFFWIFGLTLNPKPPTAQSKHFSGYSAYRFLSRHLFTLHSGIVSGLRVGVEGCASMLWGLLQG